MPRFFVTFVLLLAVLFGLELTPWAQAAVVAPWTDAVARVATALIHTFDPGVRTSGNVISAAKGAFAVSIEAGCNGVEATLVLVAAIVAFPATWRHRLTGIAIGTVAVQGLNVVRVISLFYLGQWNYDAFEWAHLYVWQALIMLDVLIVWLLWVRLLPEQRGGAVPPAGTAIA
ncbi:MAG TPA: exosortase H [Casimicrobiaceae bacterium]|nr:exosortase H [Casimicrobiaceae bacterium]